MMRENAYLRAAATTGRLLCVSQLLRTALLSLVLVLSAAAPAISQSANSFEWFGRVLIGTSAIRKVTASPGYSISIEPDFVWPGFGDFTLVESDCEGERVSGCEIAVRFTPTDVGSRLGWLAMRSKRDGTLVSNTLLAGFAFMLGIESFELDPSRVVGQQTVTGTLVLRDPAPPEGLVVTLHSSLQEAPVPSEITVPPGATRQTFTFRTKALAGSDARTASIEARYSDNWKTATLTLEPSPVKVLLEQANGPNGASLPRWVKPSVLKRINNGLPARYLFEPVRFRVKVEHDGQLTDSFDIQVRLTESEPGESGHITKRHTLDRPHGWLFSDDKDALFQDLQTLQGTFFYGGSVGPKGSYGFRKKTNDESENTRAKGVATFVYLPPEIAGIETITVEAVDRTTGGVVGTASPVVIEVSRRDLGLKPLEKARVVNGIEIYQRYGAGDGLHDRFFIHPDAEQKLIQAAELYHQLQSEDKLLKELNEKLAEHNAAAPIQPIYVSDISLPWGGLFDISGDWAPPHVTHRWGDMTDIRTTHLMKYSDGEGPEDAVGGKGADEAATSAENVVVDGLLRQAQWRQFQLLREAIEQYAIDSDRAIIDNEGGVRNHFHVQWLPAPSEH
jgi:hypothetical protein